MDGPGGGETYILVYKKISPFYRTSFKLQNLVDNYPIGIPFKEKYS